MENSVKKLIKALYEHGKKVSKLPHFNAYLYSLSDILEEIDVRREDIVDSLGNNSYLVWVEPEGIKLSPEGLSYCQTELDKPPLGFIQE